jgi:hypothetical protein
LPFKDSIERVALASRGNGGWVIWISTGFGQASKPRAASFTHANPFTAGIHNLSDYGSIITPFDFIASKPTLNALQTKEAYTERIHADEAALRGLSDFPAQDFESTRSRIPDSCCSLDLANRLKSLGASRIFIAGFCDDGAVAKTALASALLGIPTVAIVDAMLSRDISGRPERRLPEEHAERCAMAITRERKSLVQHGEANKLSVYRTERPELLRIAAFDSLHRP